jgi:hypothetical protein
MSLVAPATARVLTSAAHVLLASIGMTKIVSRVQQILIRVLELSI